MCSHDYHPKLGILAKVSTSGKAASIHRVEVSIAFVFSRLKKKKLFQSVMNLILFPIHIAHLRIPDVTIRNKSIHLGHAFNDRKFQSCPAYVSAKY